ncbi:MAG: hypothetical protein AVDCRST_MAG68-5691, partial [uncultured Gemmatimonadetes bacterium]
CSLAASSPCPASARPPRRARRLRRVVPSPARSASHRAVSTCSSAAPSPTPRHWRSCSAGTGSRSRTRRVRPSRRRRRSVSSCVSCRRTSAPTPPSERSGSSADWRRRPVFGYRTDWTASHKKP